MCVCVCVDVIEETIETNNLACSVRGRENCEAGDVDVQTTLKDVGAHTHTHTHCTISD